MPNRSKRQVACRHLVTALAISDGVQDESADCSGSRIAAARIVAASSAEQSTSKAVRFCDFPQEPLRCMLRLAFFPLLGWLGLIDR